MVIFPFLGVLKTKAYTKRNMNGKQKNGKEKERDDSRTENKGKVGRKRKKKIGTTQGYSAERR